MSSEGAPYTTGGRAWTIEPDLPVTGPQGVGKILEVFRTHAERPFLIEVSTDRRYSFDDFREHSRQGGALLAERGIGEGDRVALSLPNSAELASFYFSCFWLGAAAVPVRSDDPPEEVAAGLDQARPDLVVADPGSAPHVCRYAVNRDIDLLPIVPWGTTEERSVSLDKWRLQGGETVRPAASAFSPPDADRLLSITFTSGTTSVPKGVAHRTSSLVGNAVAFNRHMGFGPDHRFYHVMRMTYMAGWLNMLLAPFISGGSVVVDRAFDARTPLTFWEPVVEHDANAFWVAPAMLEALLRVDRSERGREYCRETVEAICVGTAPLAQETRVKFEERYETELLESYGLSELLIISAARPNGASSAGAGPILEEADVRLTGSEKIADTQAAGGEIVVRTPHRMAGYLDPDTGAPEEPPEWFETGDVGRIDAEGNLHLEGRKKDLIIRGGVNVSPRSVEERIRKHPGVEDVGVVGVEDTMYGQAVVAAVVPNADADEERLVEELRSLCRKSLRPEAVPGQFLLFDSLPRSSTTGEVRRSRLLERIEDELHSDGR